MNEFSSEGFQMITETFRSGAGKYTIDNNYDETIRLWRESIDIDVELMIIMTVNYHIGLSVIILTRFNDLLSLMKLMTITLSYYFLTTTIIVSSQLILS